MAAASSETTISTLILQAPSLASSRSFSLLTADPGPDIVIRYYNSSRLHLCLAATVFSSSFPEDELHLDLPLAHQAAAVLS